MANFLDLCEEYFDTRDFYEVLKVKRNATDKELKKAYHKVSLLVHPDRVSETEKKQATEKFKVLGKIHSILQNSDKRKIYDETGGFDEEESDALFNWMEYWRNMFKPITKKDIEECERQYIGSDDELRDIKKAYVIRKGDWNHILEMVPFSNCDSEPRIMEIVQKMVDAGEVERYDAFFAEPQRKRDSRRKRYDRERQESEAMVEAMGGLEEMIQKSQSKFLNFLDDLETKYSNPKKRKSIKSSDQASTSKTRRTRSSRK